MRAGAKLSNIYNMAKDNKNKSNNNIIGSFLLDEVTVKPSKQDKANLIASRVSKNISNFGSDYVLPIMSSLPIPGEELAMLALGKGLSAIRNSKALKPLLDHIVFKGKRFKDSMKESIKHQYYNSNLPWITKPNKDNYFRAVRTKDALEDVIDTGVVRAKSKTLKDYDPYAYLSKVFPNSAPYFAKGRPMNGKYNLINFGDYIIEVSNKHPFVGSVNMKVREPNFNRHIFDAINTDFNKHHSIDTWVVPKEALEYQDGLWRIGDTDKYISIDDVENFYVSDWFRGMKPINPKTYKPKEKVNQFINMSDENALIRSLIKYETQQEKQKGGMVKTLKGRRRRYDIGGARDSVNQVTGSSWGAEKGIAGKSTSKGALTGLGSGALVGAGIGSIVPGIGTAIGGLVGAAAGLISGLFGGGLVGRKKKKAAKEAAIRADMTHNYELGQDAIREDQAKLNDFQMNGNPIDIYGDNPQPVSNPGVTQLNPNVGGINPANGLPYRNGGKRRYYAGGGQIQQVASDAAIVNGPSHEQGGVPYGDNAELEGGEAIMQGSNSDYIFSDTLGIGNRTFADIAKPLMQHKGYLESQLNNVGVMLGKALELTDRSTYAIDRNTNGRNAEKSQMRYYDILNQIQQVQAELDTLYNQQEAMKAEQGELSEPRTEMRYGGDVRKYQFAGAVPRIEPMTIRPLNHTLDMSLGKVNTGQLTDIAGQAATKAGNLTAGANFATAAVSMALQGWNEAVTNKHNAAVASAPSWVQKVVSGFRCGGKRKLESGGSIQLSPFTEIPYDENSYTNKMITKPFQLDPDVIEMRLGGRRKFNRGGKDYIPPYASYDDYLDERLSKYNIPIGNYDFNPETINKDKRKGLNIDFNLDDETKYFLKDNYGNIGKAAGSFLTTMLSAGTSKKMAKALSKSSIPKRQMLDRFEQEWDINTDASRKEVIDQVQAIEDFIKANTSNAQVARQAILRGRTAGAAQLGKLKQDELTKELAIRNETRKANKDIEAKNKELKYLNELDEVAKNAKAIKLLGQSNDVKMQAIANLIGDIGTMYQSNVNKKYMNAMDLINLLKNEKGAEALKQVDYDTKIRAFGYKAANNLRGRRKGGKVKRCA